MSQRITRNTKKRALRDFSEEGHSKITSLGTEQLQKKAAQNTVSKFSQMLLNSN